MKTLFILSVMAIIIAVGIAAYGYLEIKEIKAFQRISLECQKEWANHWEEFTVWDIQHGDTASQQQYNAKWKKYALDGLVLDARCLDRMESVLNENYRNFAIP